MNKRNSGTAFLLVGAILAVVAAFLAVSLVRNFNETDRVVIAVRDIQPFQQITADDVQIAEVPKIVIHANTVRDPKEVIGFYTKDTIYKGNMIDRRSLAQAKGEQSMLAAQLDTLRDPTIRAFAIPFDASTAVGGEIQPGDRVDIVAQVRIDAGNGIQMGVGKVIAAAVQVLKVSYTGDGKGNLIVALTPTEIENITFAMTSGQLRFALNPLTTDPTAARTPGVTGAQWLRNQGFEINLN